MTTRNLRSNLWLLLGIALVVLAHLRFGIGLLAWLAPMPFLYFLRLRPGLGARGLLLAASALAFTLAMLKIITPPVPWAIAPGFGAPVGIVLALPYLGSDLLRRRLGENVGTLAFAALTVLAEWSLHALLPFGTWGSLVNTQPDHLALLQLCAVTGTHGVSALMAASASLVTRALAGERQTLRRPAGAALLVLLGAVTWGQARLAAATSAGHVQRRVAAVGTDSLVGTQRELPDRARLAQVERGLFSRTEQAKQAGASIVVWNEAATMVWPKDEAAFEGRLRALARRLQVDVVAAYIAPALVFTHATLQTRLPRANADLLSVLDRHAERLVSELPVREADLASRVRVALGEELGGGDASAEHVAKRLGMSERTLQRRLADEHTSFVDLLAEVRHQLACDYLRSPRVSLTEIAWLLGFSEQSAFSRAFKRWTGSSPAAYRKASRSA